MGIDNMPDNRDSTIMRVAGQILQFVSQSSGAKHFLYLLQIIGFFLVLFAFFGYPLYAFCSFLVFCAGISGFMGYLAIYHKDMFREDKYWIQLQKIQLGNKTSGLMELPTQTEFYQPTIKNIPKSLTYEVEPVSGKEVKI